MPSITLLTSIIIVLFLIIIFLLARLLALRQRYNKLSFEYSSVRVKHGKAWEDFVPFMPEFQKIANRENFVFIGMPVDGIAFDDNAIKFIEIKTGKSALSQKQKHIKELVKSKNVEWHELRF